jgi:hypothetical protein
VLWRAVVRTDPNRGQDVRKVAALEESSRRAAFELHSDAWGRDSLSGEERNRLFLSLGGKQFRDLSGISGADHVGDGRSVCLLDYDRDGWTDIASVNTNAPKLVLFRNRLGDRLARDGRHTVALRFVGGQTSAAPSERWSNRDGYGARVEVRAGGKVYVEEHRCGEGYSAQNSPTLRVGLGGAKTIDSIKVTWPGGVEHEAAGLAADQLVTNYENPGSSPTGEAFVSDAQYLRQPVAPGGSRPAPASTFAPDLAGGVADGNGLRLYILMATWCPNCARELPHLRWLRQRTPGADLQMVGLPADPAETEPTLREFAAKNDLPYALAAKLSGSDRQRLGELLGRDLAEQPLPAAVLTDASGGVLYAGRRLPTLSDIAGFLGR